MSISSGSRHRKRAHRSGVLLVSHRVTQISELQLRYCREKKQQRHDEDWIRFERGQGCIDCTTSLRSAEIPHHTEIDCGGTTRCGSRTKCRPRRRHHVVIVLPTTIPPMLRSFHTIGVFQQEKLPETRRILRERRDMLVMVEMSATFGSLSFLVSGNPSPGPTRAPYDDTMAV